MWYVLAAANALSGDADLIAGTQLKVPEMAASKNDATSFRPYNPGEIVGSTSPQLLPAPPKSGCSTIATIIRVVIAVVIAVYAPQASYAILMSAGGEAVAQTVEINQGYREGYNVGAIVVAGISAGVSPGGTTTWGKIGMAAVRAAGNYATSYLVNRALGIQDSFSWRGVASAAVSSAIAQAAFGNTPTETAAAQSRAGSMIPSSAPFSWSRVAQGVVVAAKEAGKSVIRSGIGYAVDKAIIGEAHWNWGQVMSSAAVQAGSAFGGAYRQSGIEYNALKSQGLSEQDARMMAWGERVKTGQGQDAIDLKPRYDALDPNRDGKHTKEDWMYFSASNAGTYSLAVPVDMNLLTEASSAENPFAGIVGFPGIEDDGVVCLAPSLKVVKADSQAEFIKSIYGPALAVSQQTGLSFELMLAQAAQETGWGKKVLPDTKNIFNIKSSPGWSGAVKEFIVPEYTSSGKKYYETSNFRVYPSIEESLSDRVKFLTSNKRYADLFKPEIKGNFAKEAEVLQRAGYATDPNYASSLIKVFNGPTMQRSIEYAKKHQQP